MSDSTGRGDDDGANTTWAAARLYAAKGLATLPLQKNAKVPATRNGLKDATTDASQHAAWWGDGNPRGFGIGIVPAPGCFVVDIDQPGGFDTWQTLTSEHGDTAATWSAKTPNGGKHLWFTGLPVDARYAKTFGLNVDNRTSRNYLAAWPSKVEKKDGSGLGEYTWDDIDAPIAAADQWLIDRAVRTETPYPTGGSVATAVGGDRHRYEPILKTALDKVRDSSEGRNNTVNEVLFDLYGFVKGGAFTRDEIDNAVWDAVPQDRGEAYTPDEFDNTRASTWQSASAKVLPDNPRPSAPAGDVQEQDPGQRAVYPSPGAPLDVARRIYEQYRTKVTGLHKLFYWRGNWTRWRETHWAEMDVAELRSGIYETLGAVDYDKPIRRGGATSYELTPWDPDKRKVINVLDAMQAVGHLSAELDQPSWTDGQAGRPPAHQVISCRNGLLDLSTRTLLEHSPSFFNSVSVPFDHDSGAPRPAVWHDFLKSVWPNDPDSVALLQEYVGYILSGRTDMQKMLLLIGPTRSGKGTIARMLTELVGRGHVAGPTLASLGTNFGLSPLLDKPLAIISDARLGAQPAHTVVERLLSITGEDMLTIDRKFRDPWSGKLSSRFVILSNELPKFRDASGAIANRLVILQMTNSFLGREDRTLDERLAAELPGILNWALEGLDRLIRNGRFSAPKSSHDAASLMMDMASPVSAFVRDMCERTPESTVESDALYGMWKLWAEDNGHHAGAKSSFGRDLRSVAPELTLTQRSARGGRVRAYVGIGLNSERVAEFRAGPYSASTFTPDLPPAGDPGRCADCGHHIELQGHHVDCSQNQALF